MLTRRSGEDRAVLPSLRYEQQLIALLRNFRGELDHLGINNECAVMLALLRADEVRLGVDSYWGLDDSYQTLFDRKTLVLPDVVARSEATPEQAMKSAFDLMWQAAGFVGSRNYNSAGEWVHG